MLGCIVRPPDAALECMNGRGRSVLVVLKDPSNYRDRIMVVPTYAGCCVPISVWSMKWILIEKYEQAKSKEFCLSSKTRGLGFSGM